MCGVKKILSIYILALFWLDYVVNCQNVTSPQANSGTDIPEGVTPTTVVPITSTQKLEPRNCTTGKGISGQCAEKKGCDYSTSNIDLSLYWPHRIPRPCESGYVCCPFEFLVQQQPETNEGNMVIEFDPDD